MLLAEEKEPTAERQPWLTSGTLLAVYLMLRPISPNIWAQKAKWADPGKGEIHQERCMSTHLPLAGRRKIPVSRNRKMRIGVNAKGTPPLQISCPRGQLPPGFSVVSCGVQWPPNALVFMVKRKNQWQLERICL